MMVGAVRTFDGRRLYMAGELSEYRTFGEYLQARLAGDRRLTASSLSSTLGFAVNYISNVANGYTNPSPEAVQKIARYFGDDEQAVFVLSGFVRPQQQSSPPQVRELVLNYVARHIPVNAPGQDVRGTSPVPRSATLLVDGTACPIYLPSTSDIYTPEELAALFEEFLRTML